MNRMTNRYSHLLDEREAERKKCRKQGYEHGYAARDGKVFLWEEFFWHGFLCFATNIAIAAVLIGAWLFIQWASRS